MLRQAVTVEDRPNKGRGPALPLERRSRVQVLEICERDHGVDPSIADLIDDRVRADEPAVDEPRPQKEIVHDRRDPSPRQQAGILDQVVAVLVEGEIDRSGAKRVRPRTGGRNATRQNPERIDSGF